MSIDETLDELICTQKSLVRFGDGEIVMIRGKGLYFQKESEEIAKRLSEILMYQEEGLMVAIPDIFDGLTQYRKSGQKFWKDHLLFFRNVYQEFCNTEKRYGNAFISRCYYNFDDKSRSAGWFLKFRSIWKNCRVVVVEGEGTHNGEGNDLLSNAKEVKRIICPAQNAGDKLKEIREACFRCPKESLYLLSIGPTAKLLAQDLFRSGRRAIDIGNLDMEYEWFLNRTNEKMKLEKHYIFGEEENRKAGFHAYWNQIIEKIE